MASALIIQQRSVYIFKPYSTFSYLEQRFILASCKHRIIFCHWFVAKTSKYREHLLIVFILTLEATVLKVIRIFLYQPITINSWSLTLSSLSLSANQQFEWILIKQKLNDSKNSGKLTVKYSHLSSFAIQSSSLCRTAQTLTTDHYFSFPIPHSPFLVLVTSVLFSRSRDDTNGCYSNEEWGMGNGEWEIVVSGNI